MPTDLIVIRCPDCRAKFYLESDAIEDVDTVNCPLCPCEIELEDA